MVIIMVMPDFYMLLFYLNISILIYMYIQYSELNAYLIACYDILTQLSTHFYDFERQYFFS